MPRVGKNGGFIKKLRTMAGNPAHAGVVDYEQEECCIRILDHTRFQNQVMGRYFRHRNFNSFVRQLNLYGFKKVREQAEPISFTHPRLLRFKILSSIASLKPRRNALSLQRDSEELIEQAYRANLQRRRRRSPSPEISNRQSVRQQSSPEREATPPAASVAPPPVSQPPVVGPLSMGSMGPPPGMWLTMQPTVVSLPMGVPYPFGYMPTFYNPNNPSP